MSVTQSLPTNPGYSPVLVRPVEWLLKCELHQRNHITEFASIPEEIKLPRAFLWHKNGFPKVQEHTLTVQVDETKDRFLIIESISWQRGWNPEWLQWRFVPQAIADVELGLVLQEQDDYVGNGVRILVRKGSERKISFKHLVRVGSIPTEAEFPYWILVREWDPETGPSNDGMTIGCNLTVKYPPSKLLDQLPTVYQVAMQDLALSESGERNLPFFARYLLGYESYQEDLFDFIDHLDELFGAFTSPSAHLDWLSSWVCGIFHPGWTDMQRRKFISEAIRIYQWRGTKKGLSMHLKLYTGYDPVIDDQIVEGMKIGTNARLGGQTTKLGNIRQHCFVVTIAVPDKSKINAAVIERIIQFEKPAHTAYTLNIVQRIVPSAATQDTTSEQSEPTTPKASPKNSTSKKNIKESKV